MKPIFLAALLIALCVPLANAQDLTSLYPQNSFSKPEPPRRFVPGELIRVTLTRFTIPKGVKFTPPHFLDRQPIPGNLLQCYKDAAKAQKITPEIYVFPALMIADGQTKEFSQGEGVGSALARDKNGKILDNHQATFQIQRVRVTPNVRKDGVADVKFEAIETHYTEDDRTHVRSREKSVTTDRDSWNLLPGYAPGLFGGHKDRLGYGILFLSVEPAAAPAIIPARKHLNPARKYVFPARMGSRHGKPGVPARKQDVRRAENNSILGKQETKAMRKDYLPAADSKLRVWLGNFAAAASDNQITLGLTDAEIDALNAVHSTLKDVLQEVYAQKAVLESVVSEKDGVVEGATQNIRGIVRRIQMLPGVTDNLRAQLGITVARSSHSRPALFAPARLSVTADASGFNLLRWKGNGNRPGTAYLIGSKRNLTGDWQMTDVVTAMRYKHFIETPGMPMLYRVSARRRSENSVPTAPVSVYGA